MEREKTRRLYAFALVCALFSNVAWLAYAVTSASIPELPGLEDPALRLQELLAIQGQTLVYGWSGTIGAFLTMPYMFAMVWAVSAYGPLRWVALLIGLSGALLTAQAFLAVSVSPAYFSVPQISAQPGLIAESLAALEIAQAQFEAQWFLGSFLAYGVATFWIALALHSAKVGPGRLQWVGVAGGIAGIIWLRPFVTVLMPIAVFGSLTNILLLIVWSIGTCWVLWRGT